MSQNTYTMTQSQDSILAKNKVLKNTYLLLSATLLFSALTAGYAMVSNATMPTGFVGVIILLAGVYGLMFLTMRLRNSPWGVLSIFGFTGFLGYTLGPVLNLYINTYANGTALVMTSLGATGVIFLTLSAYAITTKKDFSYLNSFIAVGIVVVILGMLANIFLQMPMLYILTSGIFALISSGMILLQTSLIINGGERNYIMATISLYVALYNLFVSLLNILSAFAGNRE